MPGTSSSISLGRSCPSDYANGHTGSSQWDLVLEATAGTPVFAVGDGRVAKIGNEPKGGGGYGRFILLEFDNPKYDATANQCSGVAEYENLYALYAHLEHIELDVKVGTEVDAGQQLGKTGRSGNITTEPSHLHFEIKPNDTMTKSSNNVRFDPGEVFGYELYNCGDTGLVNQELFGSCQAEDGD